ncbi:uncharacterized protein VICG_01823 [Vittaforma corneae ATCC 50505]|uniref:J domain-containing protein n=1 Tax=Vittaforma corneae (strain ATCC 50505) TaxID=993615 RepID=L2GKI7_VITCO|nr:uncharacterized protein VICG_01823 [Vittaforma corneae ATCC 50505]ELA41124.1 hypothetical protein VICG_01823 [Vittaforma corneae ATCC 50505]
MHANNTISCKAADSSALDTSYFDLFNLPRSFCIDKTLLKKNYYSASRKSHPDLCGKNNVSIADSHILNRAYSILNDDFLRAKLFTVPSESVDPNFLEKCIELEDRIMSGEDLSKHLLEKMEECKAHYADPVYLCKWGYYKRLYEIIRNKA